MNTQAFTDHPVTRCVAQVADALDGVREVDPAYLSAQAHRDALIDLTRLTGQLEELRMRVIEAAAGPGGVAQADGARSPASWLAAHTLTGFGPARRAEALATAVAQRWHQVGTALADGTMRIEQAHVIVKALDALPAAEVGDDLLARAEAHLVHQALTFDPRKLETLGQKILEVIAPDTYDDLERKALEAAQRRANNATSLTLRRRGDGATDLHARIPDAVASRLKTLLEAWTSPRHDTNSTNNTGSSSVQRDPATGLRLTQERLLGNAFCAFLEAVDPARMPIHGGAATRIVITLDYETLRTGLGIATLTTSGEDQIKIPASEVRRLACQAHLIPAVLGTDSTVLDLGRDSRVFKDKQRLAKMLTQPTCGAEHCTIPSTWSEAHHQHDPWSHGGTTNLDDLLFLCSWHHQRAHDPAYSTKKLPNGDVRFARRT